jgi:polyglycine hydrolase-like protein
MEITRRNTLFAGSALALTAGLPAAALAFPAWEAHNGMSSAEYQAKFDQMAAQGFKLVEVDGYTVNGNILFAAIWINNGGSAWTARHNLDGAAYQQAFNDFTSQGYRLRWISSYADPGGGPLYAAIFDKDTSTPWEARHGMTPADFQVRFDQLAAQGYRLSCVSVSSVGFSTLNVSGIWEKSGGGAWEAHSQMSAAEYQQKFDALSAQGLRPRMVKGYNYLGTPHFAAIWVAAGGGAWEAHHNMTAGQFQATFDQMAVNGFWLSDVTGYQIGNGPGYAGIWLKT